MSGITAEAYLTFAKSVEGFVEGSERGTYWLKVTSGVLFITGTFLLIIGGLSGSLVSAGSGAVGLAAAAWSIRQLYRVWKDGRFLEMLKSLTDYAKTLPEPQRTQLLKDIADMLLEWVEIEEPLPEAKR